MRITWGLVNHRPSDVRLLVPDEQIVLGERTNLHELVFFAETHAGCA
jgi:hypothetical protein